MKGKDLTRKAAELNSSVPQLSEVYPWKVLSKLSLDLKEYLSSEEFDRIQKIARYRDFDGYMVLAEEWGLQCIAPADTTLAKVRAKYLLASLIKKFQFSSDKDERIARATEIFLSAESECKSYNQENYKSLSEPETEWANNIRIYAQQFLRKLLGPELPGSRALLDKSRHGPGATIGTDGGDISAYHKFAGWPYSCTKDAYRYARFAIETDQRWFGALQNSYRKRMKIPMHYPIDMERFWAEVIDISYGNRITFVPKDARKERTIAIEPTLNLYLQLGVDGFIRRRLKRFGVDLDDQRKNQRLAHVGSLHCEGEDSFVTIDLSAASDSISLKLCEMLLPTDWFSYLKDLRCQNGSIGDVDRPDSVFIEYEKISSMGNGYTFALESALFTALVWAVMKADGVPFDRDAFAVYGDDIIVKKRFYFKVVEALRLAGFALNLEKTFVYGPIRESCGTDWLHGSPIRPVLLTKVPTDVMELFCDHNRIKRLLSLRWDLDNSSSVLVYIRSLMPKRALSLIGPNSDEDFDTYLHVDAPRPGMYKRCLYKYRRFMIMPMRRPGRLFLFRKLMHDLRGKQIPPNPWEGKLKGKGSRFTVTRRNALTVGYTYSRTDFWSDKYAEVDPYQQTSGIVVWLSDRASVLKFR